MKRFYEELIALGQAHVPVAVATVIESKGSTPREVGAKMIVLGEERILGTVGGGCGEAQVIVDAVRILDGEPPRISRVDLTGELNDLSQTNCGGIMEVFVDRLRWKESPPVVGIAPREAVELILEASAKRRRVVLTTVVENQEHQPALPVGTKWVLEEDGQIHGTLPSGPLGDILREEAAGVIARGQSRRIRLASEGDPLVTTRKEARMSLFLEVIGPPPELLIVGAGHIAVPLAKIGKVLDFEVTVLDDRPAFARRERFPEADRVIVGWIDDVLRQYPVGPETHLVLVTRGHKLDEAALKIVIDKGASYLGMIGSQRRVREVFRNLREFGIAEELIRRVHAPIGLEIGAETPAEIALAIAAEIVRVRRGGPADPQSMQERVWRSSAGGTSVPSARRTATGRERAAGR